MASPPRILHVIPYLNTRMGGDVYTCINIIRRLKDMGYDVDVFTTDFEIEDRLVEELKSLSIGITVFKHDFSISQLIYSREMSKHLKTRTRDYQIAHVHSYRSFQSYLICRYGKKFGISRIIMQPHGSFAKRGGKYVLKCIFDIMLSRHMLSSIDGWIAVSGEEKICLEGGGIRQDIRIIYPGFDNCIYEGLPKDSRFKEELKIDGPLLLYVGRIHRTKGLDFSIEGYSRIVERYPNSRFVICGADGGEKEILIRLVKKLGIMRNVIFLGFIENDRKIAALSDADIFIHTVRYMSGVGIAPMEAILCGATPIVTRECSEAIGGLGCVKIVEYGDVYSLEKTIQEVLSNKQLFSDMNNECRELVLGQMGFDKTIEMYIDFYFLNGQGEATH